MDDSARPAGRRGVLPPVGLRPMHPTAARALPPDQPRWAFEATWDGYRALAHVAAGRCG